MLQINSTGWNYLAKYIFEELEQLSTSCLFSVHKHNVEMGTYAWFNIVNGVNTACNVDLYVFWAVKEI